MSTLKERLFEAYRLQDHPKREILYDLAVGYARNKHHKAIEATLLSLLPLIEESTADPEERTLRERTTALMRATRTCLNCGTELILTDRSGHGYCSVACIKQKPPMVACLEIEHGKPIGKILEEAVLNEGKIGAAAQSLGITHETFNQWRKRWGGQIKTPKQHKQTPKKAEIEREYGAPIEKVIDTLLKQNLPRREVARILGTSETFVYRYQADESRKIDRYKHKEA